MPDSKVSKTARTEVRALPAWAEDLRRRYLRNEASMFVLHGNVYDVVLYGGKMLSLSDFLTGVLLKDSKETVLLYNVATGIRFTKRGPLADALDELANVTQKDRVLPALERLLSASNKTAVVLEYAEALAPTGDPAFQGDSDRAALVTLHRWSFLPEIEKGDNVVLLVAENLTDLSPKLLSNPKVAVVEVPMPDTPTRGEAAKQADPDLSDRDAGRYADQTAGLKVIQITSLLSAGMTDAARTEADRLIAERKREILERECFGLVEFVVPEHGFEVVGGMEEVKKDLLLIAENIREGRTSRVPMGILFTGPMGTGKTFVAEAFAKECGLTTIKLKNFRSKWVGATEGNLEKILNVIKAIGQVVVIIDEGDRAFGSGEGESDGGTSSRVIARIKEFMSDTSNRGRILFLVMTNRPDKLDVDLKRAGRLDKKIPFLYSQTPEEVENVARAQVRKNHISTKVDFTAIREDFSKKLVGYSNADVEAIILMANDDAAQQAGSAGAPNGPARQSGDAEVMAKHLITAAHDYFPSRDAELLEYMELLAVFESSSRRLLPAKYANMTPEELDARLRLLRATVGNRR